MAGSLWLYLCGCSEARQGVSEPNDLHRSSSSPRATITVTTILLQVPVLQSTSTLQNISYHREAKSSPLRYLQCFNPPQYTRPSQCRMFACYQSAPATHTLPLHPDTKLLPVKKYCANWRQIMTTPSLFLLRDVELWLLCFVAYGLRSPLPVPHTWPATGHHHVITPLDAKNWFSFPVEWSFVCFFFFCSLCSLALCQRAGRSISFVHAPLT